MYAVYPYIIHKTVRYSYKCMDFLRLTYTMASILFVVNWQTLDPDQMPQNKASDQGLHCLLIDCPIKIGITMKNTTQTLKTEMDRSN